MGASFALLLLALVVGLGLGSTWIAPGSLVRQLAHPGGGTLSAIVWDIRLPRVLGGALVGGCLALAGLVFQALLRNPLADPYLIGTSSGASLGATLSLVLAPAAAAAQPAGAFLGAVGAVVAVWGAARRRSGSSTATLVLIGYALSVILGEATALLLLFDSSALRSIFFWELGGLGGMLWTQVAELAAALLIGLVGVAAAHRSLDALSLGEAEAHSLGVDVQRTRWRLILLAGLVTAVAVSASGLIGFVGLVAPHVARRLVGGAHRWALLVSVPAGGAFLVLADALARSLPGVGEIPVGIVTGLVGGPLFIGMLVRREGGRA